METSKIHVPHSLLRELVVGERKYRSSCDFRLNQEDLEMAHRDLEETEERRNAALSNLKEMLARDKDFTYRTDDAYLLRYLRYRKFNCKSAYKKLRYFYATRNEYPEMFYTLSSIESLLNTKIANILPYTNEEGTLLFIANAGNWKPGEQGLHSFIKLCALVADLITLNPHIQINGLICIVDLAGLGFSQMSAALRPSLMRLWIKMVQELYPGRLCRVIALNCNSFLYAAFATVRIFLKKKISDRVIFLRSDFSELHEYVSPALLPKKYGGSLDDEECYFFLNKFVLGNLKYLEYENSFIDKSKV